MKFENTEVFNFEGALRGMRQPLQSHDKSDSFYLCEQDMEGKEHWFTYKIGKNDLELAQKLILAGDEHAKFMRQIFVSVDITAPIFWWKEADTYKVGTVANSTSTMHKITSKPITRQCFDSGIHTYNGYTNAILEDPVIDEFIPKLIDFLEYLRKEFLKTKNKSYWEALINWLPESWLQTRTWTANYAVLRNTYFQRRNHKMAHWHEFCEWIESLPYSKELITLEK